MMLSIESAIRLGLLLRPRNQNDWYDIISMSHAFLVVFIGFIILLIQAAHDFNIHKYEIFFSSENSISINLLYIMSILYYTYDIYPTHTQYSASLRVNYNISNLLYYVGFMLHHFLTLFGLISSLYYNVCGRIILLCFMLGELSNIPRLIHKIILRRMGGNNNTNINNNNNNNGNSSNSEYSSYYSLLYKCYICYKASFIWCRMLSTQLTVKIIQPLAPFVITLSAYLLIIFTVAAVLVEWRLSQNTVWNVANSLNFGNRHMRSATLKRKQSPTSQITQNNNDNNNISTNNNGNIRNGNNKNDSKSNNVTTQMKQSKRTTIHRR